MWFHCGLSGDYACSVVVSSPVSKVIEHQGPLDCCYSTRFESERRQEAFLSHPPLTLNTHSHTATHLYKLSLSHTHTHTHTHRHTHTHAHKHTTHIYTQCQHAFTYPCTRPRPHSDMRLTVLASGCPPRPVAHRPSAVAGGRPCAHYNANAITAVSGRLVFPRPL